jgi:hypothetical protein
MMMMMAMTTTLNNYVFDFSKTNDIPKDLLMFPYSLNATGCLVLYSKS